jgi:putative transposase
LENYDNNINNLKETIVLDPGIRTFLTGLSNKTVTHIGYKMDKKIKKLHLNINNLNNINKIRKKKKKIKKIRRKIKNLINEMHNKTISYLTSNYKNILIGNMSSKSIVKKGNNINKLTKQIAMSYNFYVFKQKLLNKCIEKRNNYKEIDESYTSKMCSNCGTLNNKLKGSKIFSCNNCNLLIDRDVNGARGILIKSL